MATYSWGTRPAYAISLDGENYVSGLNNVGLPQVNCENDTPSTCAVSVLTFQGKIYVAYADAGTHGLDVAIATPGQNSQYYSWSIVWQDASVYLNTSPGMAISPDGNTLVIIYGTRSDPNTKNQFFETTYNPASGWTHASEGGNLQALRLSSAARPALSVLTVGGVPTLFLCSQQNNSNHQLFVYKSTDGINWTFVEDFSGLALGGGAQMVTWQNQLVLANQQNNSNRALFIFSSPDGVNWYAQEYPNYRMGADPGLALYNGGISLVFRANDSGAALYGSFTTDYTY